MATRRKKYSYWSRGDDWKSPEQLAAEEAQGGAPTFAEPAPIEVTPPTEEPVAPATPDDFLTRVGKTAIGFGDVVTSGIESKFTNSELASTRRGLAMDEEEQALTSAAAKLKTALGAVLPGPLSTAAQLSALDDLRQVTRAKEVQSDEEGTKALLDKLIAARAEQKARSARGYAAIDESGDPARLTRAVAAVASQPEQALPLLAGAGATAVGGPLAGYTASAATAPLPAIVVYDASYNDAVDAGLSDKDADSFAKWMSTSEYALEAFSGGIAGSFGKTVLKSAIKQWAKQTGKMALVEGASEAATGTLQDAGNLAISKASDGKLGDYAAGQLPKNLGDFMLRRYDEALAGAIGGGGMTAAPNYVEARTDSATARLAENVRLAADVSAAPPNIVAAAAKGVEQATQLNLPGFGEQQKVEPVEPLPQVETQAKSEQARTEDQLKIKAGVLQQQATEASAFADAKDAKVQEALQFDLPVNQGDVVQGTEARATAEARQKEADVLKLGVAATEQPLPLTGGEIGKKNFEDVVVGGKPFVRNKITGELQDKRQMRIEEAKVAQQLKDKETLVSKTKARETARKKYETVMIKQAADLGKDVTYVDQKLKQWDTNNPLPKVETIAAERVAAAVKKDAVVAKGSKPVKADKPVVDATAAMDKLAGVVAAPPANLESVPKSTADGTKLEAPADDAKLDKLSGALVRGLGVKKSDQLGEALKKGNVKIVRHASQLPDWSGSKTEGVYNAKDGSVYLVASELTEATAVPTILHEVAHKLRGEADGKKYDTAVTQMLGDKGAAKAVRDVEAAASRGSAIAQRAVKRAAAARDRANGNETVYAEEIIGYAVTQAELARQNKSPFGLGSVIRDIAQELNISYSKAFGSEITLTPEIIAKLNRRKFSDTLKTKPDGNKPKTGTTQMESVGGKRGTGFAEAQAKGKTYTGAVDFQERYTFSDKDSSVDLGTLEDMLDMDGPRRMASLLDHEELYKNYPKFKNLAVSILDEEGDFDGYWSRTDQAVYITRQFAEENSRNPDAIRSLLIHELQHAIQETEGFTPGANPLGLMDPDIIDNYERAANRYNGAIEYFPLADAIRNLPSDKRKEFMAASNANDTPFSKKYRILNEGYSDFLMGTDVENTVLKAIGAINNFKEAKKEYDAAYNKAMRAYERAYGEVEARAAQIRMNESQEELDEIPYEDDFGISDGITVDKTIDADAYQGKVNKDTVLESVATIEENLPPQMFESVAMELAMMVNDKPKPSEPYDGPMIATHNTRLDRVRGLAMRGLVMPSIGIINTRSRIPTEFGDVTLVLKKGFLRPYKNNRIVGGDSYSKTVRVDVRSEYEDPDTYINNFLKDYKVKYFNKVVGSAFRETLKAREAEILAEARVAIDKTLANNGAFHATNLLINIYNGAVGQGSLKLGTNLMFTLDDIMDEAGLLNKSGLAYDFKKVTDVLLPDLEGWAPEPKKVKDDEATIQVANDGELSDTSRTPLASKRAQRQLKVRNPKGNFSSSSRIEYGPFLASVKPEISNLAQLRKEARLLNKYRTDRSAKEIFEEVNNSGVMARVLLSQTAELARAGHSEAGIMLNLQKVLAPGPRQYDAHSKRNYAVIADVMAAYRAVRNAWVDYFEAKHGGVLDFQRSVAAVVVPEGLSSESVESIKKALKDAGVSIPVIRMVDGYEGHKSRPGGPRELIEALEGSGLANETVWQGSEKDVPKTGYESVYEAPETPEFKTWFGNSKIVDANGNPLKLYHGAPGGAFGFNTFMRNSLGLIFVSTEKKFANVFAGIQDDDIIGGRVREGGGVYELFVRAEKPFDYENSDDMDRLLEGNNNVLLRAYTNIFSLDGMSESSAIAKAAKALREGDWAYYETPAVIEWMEDNGYDAMYIKEANAKNLAVFDPNQLKSANSNQGTFRLDSNNIYESVVDETDDSGTKQAVRGIGRLLGIDKLLAPTALNRIVDHPGGYTAHIAVLADTQAALWKEAEARAAKKKGVKPKVIRQEIDKRIAAIDKLTDANARASALLALDRDYPGVGKAVAKMRDLKWGLSRMAYSLRRKDPKPLTDKEIAIYKKMFENAETYNTRAYQATFGLKSEKYGKEFLKRANKNPQSEEGKKLAAAVKYLVDNNLLIPDATTLSNMKKPQLRRMYETWSNRAPGKMKRATMIAELGKIVVPNRTVLEAKALRIVEEMLGQTKTLGPIAKQFVGQKLDRTILEARKEVPKVLRDVMGEITDPYVKELLSIARLTQLVARTKMLNELAEQGKDTLWTEEKGDKTKFQVNGEAFGPLDGKWVNADVQQLLRDQLTMTTSIEDAISGAQREPEQLVGKAVALGIKGATKIAGWWKLTNVVFSPQNFGANLVGSPAMAIMNGAYSPTTWATSFYKTAKALASAEFPGNEKGGDFAAELLYANVLDSATVGEFRGQVYDNIFSEIAKLDDKDPNFFTNAGKVVWDMIGTGVASAREGYALMDVWAKVASYEVRKDLLTDYYKAMGVTKSSKEISREAGYDVGSTNISYNRAPPIIKMIERTVPFAAFLTYFTEVFRSVGGSLYLAAQDAQRAAQAASAGNAKAAAIMGVAAVKRLAGTTAATGGVIALTNYMLDSEDEEEKRRRLLDPDWETNNPRVVLGQNAQGKDITLGLNRFDPLGPLNEAVVAVMRAKDGERWDQIGVEIEGLLVKNRGAMQFYKTIWDASLKTADTLAPNLYKDIMGRTEYEDLSTNAKELLWQYVPAPAKSLSPEYPVIASSKPGDMRALGDALTGIGAKLYVRDEDKAIKFRVWDFKGTTDAIRKDYRSFLEDFDGSSEELYSAVEEFAEREEKAVSDLASAYEGYQAYGKTNRDFLAILKDEKVDGNTVKGLLTGEYRSGIFTREDLDTMFKTRATAMDKKAPDYAKQLQQLREEKAMFRDAYLRLRESE